MITTGLEKVSASYARQEGFCIEELDFALADSRVSALVGESGSGKTTVLRLLAGFMKPHSGKVWIGQELMADSRRFVPPELRRVGVLFQDCALFPHLRVAQNILFSQEQAKSNAKSRRQLLADLSAAFGLSGLEQRQPHQLSGGQMQRVALARAFAARPRLLILDEPFSSVNMELRESMLQYMQEIIASLSMQVLFITHSKNEAFQIADHLAILRQGRLLQQGSPQFLYEQPNCEYVARYFDTVNILPLRRRTDLLESPLGLLSWQQLQEPERAGQRTWQEAEDCQTARFCLRPHELELCLQPASRAAAELSRVRLLERRYYGSYYQAICQSIPFPEAGRIAVQISSRPAARGTILYLRRKQEHIRPIHLLPAN